MLSSCLCPDDNLPLLLEHGRQIRRGRRRTGSKSLARFLEGDARLPLLLTQHRFVGQALLDLRESVESVIEPFDGRRRGRPKWRVGIERNIRSLLTEQDRWCAASRRTVNLDTASVSGVTRGFVRNRKRWVGV